MSVLVGYWCYYAFPASVPAVCQKFETEKVGSGVLHSRERWRTMQFKKPEAGLDMRIHQFRCFVMQTLGNMR